MGGGNGTGEWSGKWEQYDLAAAVERKSADPSRFQQIHSQRLTLGKRLAKRLAKRKSKWQANDGQNGGEQMAMGNGDADGGGKQKWTAAAGMNRGGMDLLDRRKPAVMGYN